jgi:hypothetical protein
MIITCHRRYLEERCLQRGYSFSSVVGCVVSFDGDILTIDVDHADYPVERVGVLSFECVPDCTTPEFLCESGFCCEDKPDGSNSCVSCSSSSSSVSLCPGEGSGTWQLVLCDEEDCAYNACGQSDPNGWGSFFMTREQCMDCHNSRQTCSFDHPLCWQNM